MGPAMHRASFSARFLVLLALAACGGGGGSADAPVGADGGGSDGGTDARLPPDADTSPGFRIGGTALGVRARAVLALDVAGELQRVRVTEDGEFHFPVKVADAASYTVSLAVGAGCRLDPATASGQVAGADVTSVALYCPGLLEINQLATSSSTLVLDPPFDPEATSYAADFPFLTQPTDTVSVTATLAYPSESALTVNTVATPSGVPSAPIGMVDGAGDEIVAAVSHTQFATPRRYRVDLAARPLAQEAYLKAADAAPGNNFGAVAIDGDCLAVGAPLRGGGVVYVFRRTGGVWMQEAVLAPTAGDAFDRFGSTLAVDGDTIVVGAPGDDSAATGVSTEQITDGGASAAGAAYVFHRDGSWALSAFIKASNTEADDWFGTSVALSGDTIVVGALNEDSSAVTINGNQASNATPNAGAAYVFRLAGAWTQEAYLKPDTSDVGDTFGSAVAVSGDTVVVGAPREDSGATGIGGNQNDDGAADAGAAFVFVRSGTTWSKQAYLKASNTGAGHQFGDAVAVSGARIAVGAHFESAGGTDAGAVYVYRFGASWIFDAYLKASNAGQFDEFGRSLALDRDNLVVGAPFEASGATGTGGGGQGDNTRFGAGAVYVFRRTGSWSQIAYVKASNTGTDDGLGTSVAIAGDTAVAGAPGEDSNGSSQGDNSASAAGAVYVFR